MLNNFFQNECIESYPIVCSSSLLVQMLFTLVMWIVSIINSYQVSKEKSSEFLANLEKNLANSSDFSELTSEFRKARVSTRAYHILIYIFQIFFACLLYALSCCQKRTKMPRTWPSGPIRCDVWIVERMRYPTDRPTNGHSQ